LWLITITSNSVIPSEFKKESTVSPADSGPASIKISVPLEVLSRELSPWPTSMKVTARVSTGWAEITPSAEKELMSVIRIRVMNQETCILDLLPGIGYSLSTANLQSENFIPLIFYHFRVDSQAMIAEKMELIPHRISQLR
jgi:hypothetical protein